MCVLLSAGLIEGETEWTCKKAAPGSGESPAMGRQQEHCGVCGADGLTAAMCTASGLLHSILSV